MTTYQRLFGIFALIGAATCLYFVCLLSYQAEASSVSRASYEKVRAQLNRQSAALQSKVQFLREENLKLKREKEAKRARDDSMEVQFEALIKNAALAITAATDSSFREQQDSLHLSRSNPKERLRLSQTYAALFRKTQLSTEQREGLLNILSVWNEQSQDIGAVMQKKGLGGNDPIVNRAITEIYAERNKAIAALLGDGLGEQVKHYERRSTAESLVDKIRAQAVLSGSSISQEQASALVQTLLDSSADYAKGGSFLSAKADWNQALERASRILSPQQLSGSGFLDAVYTNQANKIFNEAILADRRKN